MSGFASVRVALAKASSPAQAYTSGEEILRFSGPLIDLETVLAKGMRQC